MAEMKFDITKVVDGAIKEFKHQGYNVSKWISVKDRLPDDCVEVLLHDTDCGILIGWYEKKDSCFVGEFMSQLDAVTHWIPLPEPPKEGNLKEVEKI